MFDKFIKTFIKDADSVSVPAVRREYGKLVGVTGIVLNAILSVAKIVAGILTGAISILSDGVNNLSDAGTSVVSLLGFKLSAKKPDKEHPFGHGRFEYFAGLTVSIVILVVAVQLFMESLSDIIGGNVSAAAHGTVFIVTVCILVFSILAKFFLAGLNRYAGKKIGSVALEATFFDIISD